MVIWRYRVYKKNQISLTKASEINIKQFLRHLKVQMMRNNRVVNDQTSSGDSDSDSSSESDSDREEDPVIQVGFIKVQYQKKDIIKETIARYCQSLLDLSISPTSVYYLGSTTFITEDTPYLKFENLIKSEIDAFFNDDILPNRNL